jgi:ribosomal protein S18 acetylase RimI-like enzyme
MPSVTVTIRRATASDLPALHALLQLYYSEGDVHHTEDEQSLHATLNQHPYGFFLAELSPTATTAQSAAANTIAGCVLYRALDTIPQAAECKRLFVLPELRGHYIAARLMDTLEDLPATPASAGSTSTAKKTSRPPSPCTAAAATPTALATTRTPRPLSFSAKILQSTKS